MRRNESKPEDLIGLLEDGQSSLAVRPRSPIEKSLFGAASYQGWEEAAPHSGLGLAVSSGAGTGYRGFQRLQPVVWGRGGGGQRRGPAQIPGNPAVRGQVAARMRVRLATVAVR